MSDAEVEGSRWYQTLFLPRLGDELTKPWLQVLVERYFQVNERKTNIYRECKGGVVHFACTAFILAVNPTLLSYAGIDSRKTAVATALTTGFACLVCGLSANLPFILAPTTATSLYFGLIIQNHNVSFEVGNAAVLLLGLLLMISSFNSLSKLLSSLIPFNIKVGSILGIALLVSLEALSQLQVVKAGTRTVLTAGDLKPDVAIAFFAFVSIAIALHHRLKGAFFIGILIATTLYSLSHANDDERAWPPASVLAEPSDFPESINLSIGFQDSLVYKLVFDLFVISVILIDGLSTGLAETAAQDDGTSYVQSPIHSSKGLQWLYVSIGIGSVLSALLSSGPVLLSPESAPGIRAGSRTGLSSVVCGVFFLLTTPFSPLLATLPPASTSPVLLMVALMLFENAKKIKWSSIKDGCVVFTMICIIPFTYSIFSGVAVGVLVFCIMGVGTDFSLWYRRLRKGLRALHRSWQLMDKNASATSPKSPLQSGLMTADDTEYRGLSSGGRSAEGHFSDDEGDDETDVRDTDEQESELLSFQLNEIGSSSSSRKNGKLALGDPFEEAVTVNSQANVNSFEEYRRLRLQQQRMKR